MTEENARFRAQEEKYEAEVSPHWKIKFGGGIGGLTFEHVCPVCGALVAGTNSTKVLHQRWHAEVGGMTFDDVDEIVDEIVRDREGEE
jgi:hypothetical protein